VSLDKGNIKAIYWDLDGTLADTEINGHRLAFNMAFDKLELPIIWEIEEYISLLKISGGKTRIAYYCNSKNISITQDYINKLHELKKEFYKTVLSQGNIQLRAGVARLIEEIHFHNIDQSIVTTSSLSAVNSFLEYILPPNLNVFKHIVSSEDVKFLKPSSEAYISAISKSGINRENILAIEDSFNGAEAAKRAGIKCLITLPSWLKSITSDYKPYENVISTLGDINNVVKVYNGPICTTNYINMDYISKIFLK